MDLICDQFMPSLPTTAGWDWLSLMPFRFCMKCSICLTFKSVMLWMSCDYLSMLYLYLFIPCVYLFIPGVYLFIPCVYLFIPGESSGTTTIIAFQVISASAELVQSYWKSGVGVDQGNIFCPIIFTISQSHQNTGYLGLMLLTWINFNPSMD